MLDLLSALSPRCSLGFKFSKPTNSTRWWGRSHLLWKATSPRTWSTASTRSSCRQIEASVERAASLEARPLLGRAYNKSIEPNRQRLAHILGVRDARVPFDAPELVGTTSRPALVGKGEGFEVFAVRWPAFGDVHGEGLLLVPTRASRSPTSSPSPTRPDAGAARGPGAGRAGRIAVRPPAGRERLPRPRPDADQSPGPHRSKLTNREFLYRSAFELGRGLIGYEVQKVLAASTGSARKRATRRRSA